MRFAYLIEPPFNYRNECGDVTGCDVELARVILAMIGIHEIEFIEAEFSQLLPGLNENLWDMTTGLFDTAERRKIVTFSHPIWALPDGLLVRKGNLRDLDGYASAAKNPECTLVAIRDQIQHRAIMEAGVPDDRILICETYTRPLRPYWMGVPTPMPAWPWPISVLCSKIQSSIWKLSPFYRMRAQQPQAHLLSANPTGNSRARSMRHFFVISDQTSTVC